MCVCVCVSKKERAQERARERARVLVYVCVREMECVFLGRRVCVCVCVVHVFTWVCVSVAVYQSGFWCGVTARVGIPSPKETCAQAEKQPWVVLVRLTVRMGDQVFSQRQSVGVCVCV